MALERGKARRRRREINARAGVAGVGDRARRRADGRARLSASSPYAAEARQ